VYWPAFLMAAGLEPPQRVFAHGWWTNEGQKISKRLGNVIDPNELISKYGLDEVRYFLLREVPFGNDGDFSHRAIVGRIDSDLANGLGNLAQRVLTMVNRNCDAKIPEPGPYQQVDERLIYDAAQMYQAVGKNIEAQQFHVALIIIWHIVSQANGYIAEQQPWALNKTDPARMKTVLYVACEVLRKIAIICHPFMPGSCDSLLRQLAVNRDQIKREDFLADRRLIPGASLPRPEAIFPRFVEGEARLKVSARLDVKVED